MKLLLDECVDRRLAKDFRDYYIQTVPQMGWATIKDGELLGLAEGEFDVFITVDRNLSFQQHLPRFDIAVLVLAATSNRLADLRVLMPDVLAVLPSLSTGEARIIRS